MALLNRLRERAGLLALLAAAAMLLIGVAVFLVSFSHVEIGIQPGQVLTYRLREIQADLSPDGRPGVERSQERKLILIGLMANQVAICHDGPNGMEVDVAAIDADGQVRSLDAGMRPREAGPALGIFDLNLLRLPPDQAARSGRATVVHALLPAGKRAVQVSVKRTKAGANSLFLLRFPEQVEWLGSDGRYRQLRNLTCEFTVNSVHGRVTEALAKADLGIELPEPRRIFRRSWSCTLSLIDDSTATDEVTRLRDTAVRIAALADPAITARRREDVLDQLRAQPVSCEPLASGVAAAFARYRGRAPTAPTSLPLATTRHLLVIDVPRGGRDDSDQVLSQLRAMGLNGQRDRSAGGTRILVGPSPSPDQTLLAQVSARLHISRSRLRWMESR